MNAAQFIAKWGRVALTERSAAHEHFYDLCEMVGHPRPAEADPTGEWFTFERGASKQAGGDGWADVWKKGYFGWEYKGKHRDLDVAYQQLLQYREALENPPLLVVCDMDRIVVRTNFTNTPTVTHEIPLAELGTARNLEILRAIFHDPEKLKPGAPSEAITREAAQRIAEIAEGLRGRGLDPADVAHFLDRMVFCLFAEDVGLLPDKLFTRLVEKSRFDAKRFGRHTRQLFEAMAHGGEFGLDEIRHFNGALFNGGPVLDIGPKEVERIWQAARLDWSAVDPSIFGTLFERGMDPAKRSQLGAHYTSREDIETLVEPVVMQPLRREWEEARRVAENLLATGQKQPAGPPKKLAGPALQKARDEAFAQIERFLIRLSTVKVLDPACGSGNFLYVTLQKLKDLEKDAILYAVEKGFPYLPPAVGPWQLYGIEISPYAFDLAQMTVWIGYLQWTHVNGFALTQDPLLRPNTTFRCMDAILDLSDPENPKEPEWPRVDFVVGNPPFLGGNRLRRELGDDYVDALFALHRGAVPAGADLCCYWFEKARAHIEAAGCRRAGLLATQGIRGGANREVLKRIKESGGIFFAESDRPWILDGANVHVSMVGFDSGAESTAMLDGASVLAIGTNLNAFADVTSAVALCANAGICLRTSEKGGSFNIDGKVALRMLQHPNPHGRPNSDVVRPWVNGDLALRRRGDLWIIDMLGRADEAHACPYEAPFRYLEEHVRYERAGNRDERLRQLWWLHRRSAEDMRGATASLGRYLLTPALSKHRVFLWADGIVLPDHQLYAFAKADDRFFGVLHSRLHEVWALRLGTRLETRPRYTPTTCFETFPFPEATAEQEAAIAEAAKELNALRERWLNPPEWTREEVLEFPGSVDGPWVRYVHEADAAGIGTVRYPRVVARDEECAAKLAKRTLTNLYNERPAWLDLAHRRLDEAVFAAYGWPASLSDEEILGKLLALNLERAGA